jgi:hypothetical protein
MRYSIQIPTPTRQARRRDEISAPPIRPVASHTRCASSMPLTPVNHGQQQDPATRPNHRSAPQMADGPSKRSIPTPDSQAIVISEPSTEVTQPVRTDQSARTRSPGSAAYHDTSGRSSARPTNVHTRTAPTRSSSPQEPPGSSCVRYQHQARHHAASLRDVCAMAQAPPLTPPLTF